MTWSDADDRWSDRLVHVARFVRPGSSVIDLGAGAQGLRDHLRRCDYTAADVVARTPETLAFDMNARLWPRGHWDVAVLSGVLEYAQNPRDVLAHVRFMAPTAIVTYRHRRSRADVASGLFLNALTPIGFNRAAHDAGWRKVLFAGEYRTDQGGKYRIWKLR